MAPHTWKTERFHHDHHTNRPGSAVNALLPAAETIAKRLIARHETIATAESSTGGLIAAALLAVPRRFGVLSRRRGGVHRIGARGAARHRRC